MILNVFPSAILAFVVACACSATSIRLGLPFAGRLAMATPVARSSHTIPIPQSGGLFVMGSVTLACVLVASLVNGGVDAELVWLAPALLLAGVGWLDDRAALPALVRLVAYALVSAAAVVAGLVAPLQLTDSWPLNHLMAICFLVAFVNITNFMDGIDGLVVVEFAPALLFMGVTAFVAGEAETGTRSFALLGGLVGFFVYNRPKAVIFLGDSGSIAIGFLAGCLLLEYARAHGVAAALLLPLYFLVDVALTLARRIVSKKRFWEGHREHFYQKALDRGQSNWSILARVGACNVALCGLSFTAGCAAPLAQAAMLAAGSACVAVLLLSLMRDAR